MPQDLLHRFEHDGKRFAIDPETCFCFECDAISWDVLEFYPAQTVNRIYDLLAGKYDRAELAEVIGELEWLRASKSILTPAKREDLVKIFEIDHGLKRLTVFLPVEAAPAEQVQRRWFGRGPAAVANAAREIGREAVNLLLARAEAQKALHLEFVEDRRVQQPEAIAECCAYARKAAQLAGKTLTASVCVADVAVSNAPEALEGHTVGVRLEFQKLDDVLPHLRALAKLGGETLGRLARTIQPGVDGVTGQIVVRPNGPAFGGVVEALDGAGFLVMEIDMEGAYVANPSLEPQSMLPGLSQCAVYYAESLLKNHYFRLDPIAALFARIYNGSPQRRTDPAGTNELAVDANGDVFPCRRMVGIEAFRLGSVVDGVLDEDRIRRFEDVGALTTADCFSCWVRNLCGGGAAAVHHALTGSFRKPYAPWCDAQRSWMAAAVSAFQRLSSQGVRFDRIYQTLGKKEKPSLFALARAVLTMTIGVRPIQEADAEMLRKWENWNGAAYFSFNENGVLLATMYDREMDSLHPRGIDQELMLIRKNGDPLGLLKIRPEYLPGVAMAWIYLREPADYASDSVRKGFRAILKEAGAQPVVRRLVVPVSPKEEELGAFLEAVGFRREGVLREALYLHGAYHDVTLYGITADAL